MGKIMRQQINSPFTSSMGRLFDAVASLVGIRQKTSFEGQAAMALEYLLEDGKTEKGLCVWVQKNY